LSGKERETFRIPISTGIFDHCPEIGEAVWLFMFYIDRTTKEVARDGESIGFVYGGRPCDDADAASTLCRSISTIRRWRRRLTIGGYIRIKRTPVGYVITVCNSKKKWERRPRKEVSDEPILATPSESDRSKPSVRTTKSVTQKVQKRHSNKDLAVPSKDKAEEAGASRSSSFDVVRKKIFEIYGKQFASRAPVFRDAEVRALETLLGEYELGKIIAAYKSYLEHGDTWDRKNRFPFCAFAGKIDEHLEAVGEEETSDDVTVEDIRPPGYIPRVKVGVKND
jgi:hypothetical protein